MKALKDKLVWITGASSGIGEALTYAFAEKGSRVIISGREFSTLEKVKAKCTYPSKVEIVVIDLAKHQGLYQSAQKVNDQFGTVDILINNAGISQRSLVIETDFKVDEQLININLLGTIALTKAVLPSMVSKKSGHIIVVSSLMGKFASKYRSSYCAAKHGLQGFFDSLRLEMHEHNVQVMLVCPGFVKTEVSKNALVADGSKQGTMDSGTENGLDPSLVAQRIISALSKNKQEVYIGKNEVLGVYANRFFPKLFSKFLRNAKVT